MTKEIWLDIEGYAGLYQVSDQGRVKSLKRKRRKNERILKPTYDGRGRLYVDLCAGGKRKRHKVHRLVCKAFHENPDNKSDVNHINENKADNRACNLEWMTHKENCNYGTRNIRSGKAIAKANSKPVAQCTKEGELVKTWSSLTEIGKQTGFGIGNISLAANGKYKQAYGFIWKYV